MTKNSEFLELGPNALPIPAGDNVIEALINANPNLGVAMADLIDNCIDGQARNIDIRFHAISEGHVAISVSDDGKGMTSEKLNGAVRLGGTQDHGLDERLGKYGVGLKVASFARSESTTIFSRRDGEVSGLLLAGDVGDRRFQEISLENPSEGFERSYVTHVPTSGTIVRWEKLRDIEHVESPSALREWLEQQSTDLGRYLGLIFNKKIRSDLDSIAITIYVVDRFGGFGVPIMVRPINPCEEEISTISRTLIGNFRGIEYQIKFVSGGFSNTQTLAGIIGQNRTSGLFVYRQSRLVRLGGWEQILVPRKQTRNARFEIEVPHEIEIRGAVSVTHSKDNIRISDEFRETLLAATTLEGETIYDLLALAEAHHRISRVKKKIPPPSIPLPIVGLNDDTVDVLRSLCRLSAGGTVSIKFQKFPGSQPAVFNWDSKSRTLLVNQSVISPSSPQSNFQSTLLLLALRNAIGSRVMSPKSIEELDAWNKVLWTALGSQSQK